MGCEQGGSSPDEVILMCGRFASFLPAEAIARLFHADKPIPNFPPTWNMAPTQDAMVARHHPETP
jgi:putative SOS response-associated peptidase YedK